MASTSPDSTLNQLTNTPSLDTSNTVILSLSNTGQRMACTKTPRSKLTMDHPSSSKVPSKSNLSHSPASTALVSLTDPEVSLVNSCTTMPTLSHQLARQMKTTKKPELSLLVVSQSTLSMRNFTTLTTAGLSRKKT